MRNYSLFHLASSALKAPPSPETIGKTRKLSYPLVLKYQILLLNLRLWVNKLNIHVVVVKQISYIMCEIQCHSLKILKIC